MLQNRRQFLASTTGMVVASSLGSFPAIAAEPPKYHAGIIGDWNNGQYGHSLHLAWSKLPSVEVVALADPHEKARAKFAKEAGAAKTYADYKEMLSVEKPNLVSVGPRQTVRHKEYLLAAVEVGAHGYMEKPLAVDLAEADEMIQAIEAKNLKWAVAHQKRMTPLIQHARKLIMEEGLIGDILELRARGKEDRRAGGEDLLVLGTHIMDLMQYFVGKPAWVAADITVEGRPAKKEDVHEASEPLGPVVGDRIQVIYGFPNGLKGYFSTMKNTEGDGGRWGLDIYGTKGIVTIRINNEPIVSLIQDPSWSLEKNEIPRGPLPDAPPPLSSDNSELITEMNTYATADLLKAIEEDREPGVSMQKARDSLEMIQAAYESYIQGGKVDLPLKERVHPLKRWS